MLVVDEAHDLHHKTLTGFKRLMEVVADADFLAGTLTGDRSRDFTEQLRVAGVPV